MSTHLEREKAAEQIAEILSRFEPQDVPAICALVELRICFDCGRKQDGKRWCRCDNDD